MSSNDIPIAEAPSVRRALLAAREAGRCALIPYLTMGYPSLEASLALLEGLEEMGVDVVEVGIPFSDPVADGPTIQATIDCALAQGVTLRSVLEALGAAEMGRDCARVLFSYFNPLLAYGLSELPPALRSRGIGAALITDMVPEEADEWLAVCAEGGLETCFLVASTSNERRMAQAARCSSAFVYCVATLGVTGSRTSLDDTALRTVARLRDSSDAPVAVGFGLSTPRDIIQVRDFADGAIVGSALLRAIEGTEDPSEVRRRGVEYLEPLLEAAHAR